MSVVLVLSVGCRHDSEKAKREAIERGNSLFARQKFSEASLEYRRAIQEDISSGEAHYRLGLVYEQMGDRPNALREFSLAANASPDRREIQLKAGQYYLFAEKYEDARKIANRLLDKNVRDVDAQLLLGNAMGGISDFETAAKMVEEAVRTEPSNIAGYSNLAAVELARGNTAKAEEAFRHALAITPQSIEARIGLASLYWSERRVPEAEQVLKEAGAIAPGNLLASRTLAALYLATGRMAEAEKPLRAISDAHPELVAPRLALADYYLSSQRSELGLPILNAVAALPDGASPALLRLARYDFAHSKLTEAYERVNKVIARDPKNPQPYLLKSAFLLAQNKNDEALAAAKMAVQASPRLARAHFAVGAIELARQNPEAAATAFQEALRVSPRFGPAALEMARLELARGQVAKAVTMADTAVRLLPDNPDARYILVRALLAQGDGQRVADALGPLQTRFGFRSKVQVLAGQHSLSENDRAGARKAFERALALDPKDNEAFGALVSLDVDAGNGAEARRRIEERLRRTPEDPAIAVLAGRVYGQLGLTQKAEDAWRTVLRLQPANLEAYQALGRMYYEQNRLDQAVDEARRLAAAQPKSAGAQTLLGFLLEMQGRLPEAQRHYQKALELDSRAGAAANNLAWLYATHGGNLDAALQLAQSAKVSLPDSPEVNDTLGWIFYKKGMKDLAVGPLEQAASGAPSRAVYHYHLGMAYLGTNSWEKARTSLKQALSLSATFEGADEARTVLATLR